MIAWSVKLAGNVLGLAKAVKIWWHFRQSHTTNIFLF